MATKDISDLQVCQAYMIVRECDFKDSEGNYIYPYDVLAGMTGQPIKVCEKAMERADRRGYIECGVSLRCGWLTEKGKALLTSSSPEKGM